MSRWNTTWLNKKETLLTKYMNGIVYKLEQAQDGGRNLHFFTIKQGLRLMLFRGLRTHT